MNSLYIRISGHPDKCSGVREREGSQQAAVQRGEPDPAFQGARPKKHGLNCSLNCRMYLCGMPSFFEPDSPVIAPEAPVVVPYRKGLVDPEALVDFAIQAEEQGQMVVHVFCPPAPDFYGIRVWRTTFLLARGTDMRSRLIHAENITMAPEWTEIAPHEPYSFTLFFERLPSDVKVFDLAEIIPQPGGFFYANIVRNQSDVYNIRL